MKQIRPDLWQTSLFKSGMLSSHAYYLKTPKGGVLLYNTGDHIDLDEIDSLGGIDFQLLTHRDESSPSQKIIRERFNSKLVCSEYESSAISENGDVDLALEEGDHNIYGIQIVETPGHTGGSISFYYESKHGNYLFTGDTIFQWNYGWSTLVISSAGGSNTALRTSLTRLKTFEPDIVMSSGFVDGSALVNVKKGEWNQVINSLIGKV